MARFYVKNDDGYWNIFSTIIDDYILPDFVPFEVMKFFVLQEMIKIREVDLNSLRTDYPQLNVMSLEEAEEHRQRR